MAIENPLMPPRLGVGSIPNVVPFTMRENFSQMGLVEGMRHWITCDLIPFINDNIDSLSNTWVEQANNLIDQFETISVGLVIEVNTALDGISGVVEDATAAKDAAEAARDQAAIYASDAANIQDAAIAGIAGTAGTETRTLLDGLYASAAQIAAVNDALAGRLSEATLDARFDDKADAPTNGNRAIGTDELRVNVQDYGALGDSEGGSTGTNDSPAIADAVAAAVALNRTLWFPQVPFGYRTDEPVVIPGTVNVVMDSPVYSNHDGVGIDYNPVGPISFRRSLRLNQRRSVQSNWSSELNIGIRTRNLSESQVWIDQASDNTIGHQRVGDGTGHVHNTFYLGRIVSNKYGIDTECVGSGWVNEELSISGRFSVQSGTNRSQNRYGVRIRATSGYVNNGQVFLHPSFELNGANTTDDAVAIPILITHGAYNRFENVRDENNSGAVIRTEGDSQQNYVSVAYGSRVGSRVEDVGSFRSSVVERLSQIAERSPKFRIFDSGPLHKLAVPYSATSTNIPGVVMFRSVDTEMARTANLVTIGDESISLPGSRAVGVLLNTHNAKRFVVRRNPVSNGGRVRVIPYDANMNRIDGSGDKKVHSIGATSFFWSPSDYGGHYSTGSDSTFDQFIALTDDVVFAFIGVSGGSAPADIISFAIDAETPSASVIHQFPENITEPVAVAPPASGTFNRGMRIKNGSPGVGLPRGWVCVESGTPGVWVSEGNL